MSKKSTPLQRSLEAGPEPARARATAFDAFLLARRKFAAGERVDMTAIADELGVNRVTLYRWVGSREHLLVEVMWSLATRAVEVHASALGRRRGGPWLADLFARFIDGCVTDPGVRRFIADEGELAMRLMTRADDGFQPRMLELIKTLLAEELKAGRMATTVPTDDLAFAILRLGESYLFLDLITGERPEPGRLAPVLQALLR